MSDYRVTFRDQAGRELSLMVSMEQVRRPSALRRLWHERGDWLIICALFVTVFTAALWVTGWF